MIQVFLVVSFMCIGVVVALTGAVKIPLATRLGVDDGRMGGLFSAMLYASFFATVAVGPLVDILGHRVLLVAGFLVSPAAVLLVTSARRYPAAVLGCILLGTGGTCLSITCMTLLPLAFFSGQRTVAALNIGNAFFGMGAFMTPFLAGLMLPRLGLTKTGRVLAWAFVPPFVIALLVGLPDFSGTFPTADAAALLTTRVVIVAGMLLFCYVGLEISMGGWLTTYAHGLGFDVRGADMLLALFWASFTIARLAASFTALRETGASGLLALAAIACMALAVMSVLRSRGLAGMLVIVCGFVLGPIFPTTVGVVFDRVPASLQGSTIAILNAAGVVGGGTLPAVMGLAARRWHIRRAFIIAAATAGCILVLAGALSVV